MLLTLGVAACAQLDTRRGGTTAPTRTANVPFVSSGTVAAAAQRETDEDRAPRPLIFEGSDAAVNMPPARQPIQLNGDAVTLNFEEAPLTDVVHAILGDILELDYIIEHPINGVVTLRTRSPVPRDQLLPILESLLQSNGALMVRDPNDRYYVSASPNLRTLLPGIENPASGGVGYSTVVVPLQYIGAAEMADILRPVASEDAFVRIDTTRNLLVLSGTRNQLNGWLDMVSTFDIDQLAGMSVGIFPIDNSTAAQIGAAIQQLINGGSVPQAAGGEGAPLQAPTSLSGLVRVIPLNELNSLMVVSPRAYYIEQVRTWVERLDQAEAASGEATLHVYSVQNGDATQLANLVGSIFGGRGMGASQASQNSGVAPGLSEMSTGGGLGGNLPSTGSSQQSGSTSVELGDNVRIVADQYNNALLIYAPRREYNKIRTALEKLDVVPAQVLIEASIIEVTLNDDLEFGVEWFLQNSLGGGRTGGALLNLNESGNIGPRIPGFSYSITNSADVMRGVINALARDSLVKVISTPSILVLDNHTAAIHVGDQQPIQGNTIMTDGGRTSVGIEYKDTGVKLEVKPSVNAGGLVTMDISQSVIDVGPVDSATSQRSFLQRDVSSRVAVRSGESVVLGGLIRDNETQGQTGLPYLKDIPVLGNMFGRSSRSGARTELLVFISPRVLNDEEDLRAISREMRSRMQGLPYFDDLPAALQDMDSELRNR